MKYKLMIGDWSKDGHEKCEDVIFETNKDAEEIRKAYLRAAKKIGVSLHDERNCTPICTEYEDSELSKEAQDKLIKAGITVFDLAGYKDKMPEEENFTIYPEDIAEIFFKMVITQMPDFEYKVISDNVESINGNWNKTLNESFGYGCFN
jgi:hypothetical protein